MKRLFLVVAVVAVIALLAFSGAFAAGAKKQAKPQTFTGEIVDLGCYLGHSAAGSGHKDCGLRCVAGGMPMGLLVDGKVYLLTPNHESGDAYASCKEWVSQKVKITGVMMARGGVQAIDVASAQPATPAAATTN
jgi:hypothetical protein